MSTRKNSFVPQEYYHLYNRGNDRRVIFHDEQDYQRFVSLLYLCNSIKKTELKLVSKDTFLFDRDKCIVAIGAYCLMPNHFHILITPIEENSVSVFMKKIGTAYSMYYNSKYSRSGSLFEGKFKSEHLSTDRYLKYIFSYIHLNPVKLIDKDWKKNGIKNKNRALSFLQSYQYSSFFEYRGESRKEEIILNKTPFPPYFASKKDFLKEIFDWLFYFQGKTLEKM